MEVADVVADHRRACDGFTAAVQSAKGHWEEASPCPDWNARGVLEHVIGFHDVLLLRPLDAKPSRPTDDPEARWVVTVDALFSALSRPEARTSERKSLISALTAEVLVHTWDLAQATGAEVSLDNDLCQAALARAMANEKQFRSSDMFGPSVLVPGDEPAQDRLVGFYGRDPNWSHGQS